MKKIMNRLTGAVALSVLLAGVSMPATAHSSHRGYKHNSAATENLNSFDPFFGKTAFEDRVRVYDKTVLLILRHDEIAQGLASSAFKMAQEAANVYHNGDIGNDIYPESHEALRQSAILLRHSDEKRQARDKEVASINAFMFVAHRQITILRRAPEYSTLITESTLRMPQSFILSQNRGKGLDDVPLIEYLPASTPTPDAGAATADTVGDTSP